MSRTRRQHNTNNPRPPAQKPPNKHGIEVWLPVIFRYAELALRVWVKLNGDFEDY